MFGQSVLMIPIRSWKALIQTKHLRSDCRATQRWFQPCWAHAEPLVSSYMHEGVGSCTRLTASCSAKTWTGTTAFPRRSSPFREPTWVLVPHCSCPRLLRPMVAGGSSWDNSGWIGAEGSCEADGPRTTPGCIRMAPHVLQTGKGQRSLRTQVVLGPSDRNPSLELSPSPSLSWLPA